MAIPRVSSMTVSAISKEFEEEVNFEEKTLKRMNEDNPEIIQFIHRLTKGQPKDAYTILQTTTIVYRLLESQSETDEMSNRLV